MKNQISLTFQSQAVRTYADEKGELWFLVNDVCTILGYANPRQAVQKNCKEKGVSIRDTPTKGGVQSMTYINEPNLYRLIIKSRKPEAEAFEAWVMEEVLPTIRKTGKYEPPRLSTVAERKPLKAAVNLLVQKTKLDYADAWRLIHQRFNVEHADELSTEQNNEALQYLHSLIIEHNLNTQATPREMFELLAKMTVFAEEYYKLKKAMCGNNPEARAQLEKVYTGWIASHPDADESGFMLCFRADLKKDINRAHTYLRRSSAEIEWAA